MASDFPPLVQNPVRVAIMSVSSFLHIHVCTFLISNNSNRGAGIGGLTLSAALGALQRQQNSESNLQIDIYESASIISEIGAGITLWPRVWNIMNAIDIGESLVKFLRKPPDDSKRK